jgi:hypothetical protein
VPGQLPLLLLPGKGVNEICVDFVARSETVLVLC